MPQRLIICFAICHLIHSLFLGFRPILLITRSLTRHCNESQHSSHFLIRHSHPSLSSHRIMWIVRNPTEQNTTTKSMGKQNTNTPTSLVKWFANTQLTTDSKQNTMTKPCVVAFATFCGINSPSLTDFKLPV